MNKHRFFVLHIRQIIKAAIIVVIGFFVLLSLIYYFAGRNNERNTLSEVYYEYKRTFVPGTYRAKVYLNYKPTFIEVTVSYNEIVSVALDTLTENQEIFYPLILPTMTIIAEEVIKNQSLNLKLGYENNITGSLLLSAIHIALSEARVDF
ncbi:MAG: hypothetical protein FWF57_01740 [Defluviitaleaceae bacterium]|nr:hypothetical protein [Defluviitaleaceae bacterium]